MRKQTIRKRRRTLFKKRIISCVILAIFFSVLGAAGFTVRSVQDEQEADSSGLCVRTVCAKETEKVETAEEETEEEEAVEEVPAEYLIEDFPIVLQTPELPTGCEITALTMALHYYGFSVDKTVMASEYLPVASADLHYGADGRLYGADMNSYFIGDPFSEGMICGTQAIVTAADEYLATQETELSAQDLTGSRAEELYRRGSQDQPVVVWVTISMADRGETQGWYTESGDYVEWSSNDHGAVLIGYTETMVTIADPISGQIEYSREQFEQVFESRGSQCLVLESGS